MVVGILPHFNAILAELARSMTTKTWVGGAGSWDNAADWSPQSIPGAGDDVTIGAGATVAVTSGAIGARSISLDGPTAVLALNGAGVNADIEGTLGGGIVLLGSPDASQPAGLFGTPLTLGMDLSLDVTETAFLGNATALAPSTTTLLDTATINVGPGGNLGLGGYFSGAGTIHIDSGTLDLTRAFVSGSSESFPIPIQMDDGAAKLVLGFGGSATVEGFRAGDILDFGDYEYPVGGAFPYSAGTYAAQVSGNQLQVLYDGNVIRSVTLAGQQTPGASYQATLSGSTDLLVTTTAEPAAAITFADQTTGATGSHAMDAASGGPSYLQWQYIDSGSDTTAMTASLPNVFLKGGSGEKALAVSSGQNVLDGGAGSSFLSGGSGTDTFFVDIRGSNSTWDTLTNFHAGDAVTVWGWVPGVSTETVDAQAGAAGYQGATLRLTGGAGGPTSSVTFAGLSTDQAAHLQMATGTAGGIPYLYLYNPGV